MIHSVEFTIRTEGFSDIRNITPEVARLCEESGLSHGLVNVFVVGSTASITTIEFEPALVEDMKEALEKLWPRALPTRHGTTWGDDNGFSHLRASFLGPNIGVPLHRGSLVLGTWQQIVVIDHDNGSRERRIFVQIHGE